jgi:hypothetical protein
MILPLHNQHFCTAIHFSHDGIVLNLFYTWGAIAMGGENGAPDCANGLPERRVRRGENALLE